MHSSTHSSSPPPIPRIPLASGVFLFWALVVLVAGTAQRYSSGGLAWSTAMYPPALAGAIWCGLTFVALWAADRFVLDRDHPNHWILHGAVALAIPFVLNATYIGVTYALMNVGSVSVGRFSRETTSAALQWLHVNAGVYFAIVLLRQAYTRTQRLDSANGAGQPTNGPFTEAAKTVASEPRFEVRSGRTLSYVTASEILWIEGAGDYVRVHTATGDHLIDDRLRDLERKLAAFGFIRVHRSAIVNLGHVRELDPRTKTDWVVVLEDGTRVNVSRGRRSEVRSAWSTRTEEGSGGRH